MGAKSNGTAAVANHMQLVCLLRLITSVIQIYNKSTIHDPFLPHLGAELVTCAMVKKWSYAVKLNSDVHFLLSQSSTYSVSEAPSCGPSVCLRCGFLWAGGTECAVLKIYREN